MKITIIGGGNMGGAIAVGTAAGGRIAPDGITVTAKTEKTLEKIRCADARIRTTTDNREAVRGADLIVVAVKPWLAEEVIASFRDLLDYRRQAVASVVAGLSFDRLEAMLDNSSGISPAMFRIIPNTAVSLGESVTFIAARGASETLLAEVVSLFDELGRTFVVEEAMMAAGTSLASCGIAFALKYLDAAIRGGQALGFDEKEARRIVMQTMQGALSLLERNGTMPRTEIDKVTTPGGLTLKGLDAMNEKGFDEAVFAGLDRSR